MSFVRRPPLILGGHLKPRVYLPFRGNLKGFGGIDLTSLYSRASIGTYWNRAGVLAQAASGVARFTYDPITGDFLGLLYEPSRTNSFTQSEAMDHTDWTTAGTGTTHVDDAAAPDGTTTADRGQDTDASAAYRDSQTKTSADDQFWTLSSFILDDDDTSIFPEMALTFTDGATVQAIASFNKNTGANAWRVQTTADEARGAVNVGSYWRCFSSGQNNASSNLSVVGQVIYAAGTSLGSFSNAAQGSTTVWGMQLELHTAGNLDVMHPTSYIPTTTAAVTRAADSFTALTSIPWFRADKGTIVVKYRYRGPLGGYPQTVIIFSDNSANNYTTIRANDTSTNSIVGEYYSGGTQRAKCNSGVAPTYDTDVGVAFAYKSGHYRLSVNGGAVVGPTSGDNGAAAAVVDRMYIGKNAGGTHEYTGTIREIAYYDEIVADQYLQGLSRPTQGYTYH